MPPLKALALAAEILGGKQALAEAIKVHPTMVSHWLSKRREIDPLFAKRIEEATGGQIKRLWLRPDIFG